MYYDYTYTPKPIFSNHVLQIRSEFNIFKIFEIAKIKYFSKVTKKTMNKIPTPIPSSNI